MAFCCRSSAPVAELIWFLTDSCHWKPNPTIGDLPSPKDCKSITGVQVGKGQWAFERLVVPVYIGAILCPPTTKARFHRWPATSTAKLLPRWPGICYCLDNLYPVNSALLIYGNPMSVPGRGIEMDAECRGRKEIPEHHVNNFRWASPIQGRISLLRTVWINPKPEIRACVLDVHLALPFILLIYWMGYCFAGQLGSTDTNTSVYVSVKL